MTYVPPALSPVTALSILIVEDDLSFALELEMMITRIGHTLAGAVSSARAALDRIHAGGIDFIVMDIALGDQLSGIDIGRRIEHLEIPILYITGYDTEENYREARNSNFVGFLVKPVGLHTLRTTIELVVDRIELSRFTAPTPPPPPEEYIFVRDGKSHRQVSINDILLLEGSGDYVKLWTGPTQHQLFRQTMREMEEMLGGEQFFRIHRSYLVHVPTIQKINFPAHRLRILDRELPISRSKRAALERVIRKLG